MPCDKYYRMKCDGCGTVLSDSTCGRSLFLSEQEAMDAAHQEGWLRKGHEWVCPKCEAKRRQEAEDGPRDWVDQTVLKTVRERFGPEDISYSTLFVDDLGLDSLDEVELVMDVEKVFGFWIPDTDLEDSKWEKASVQDLCNYVRERLPEKGDL